MTFKANYSRKTKPCLLGVKKKKKHGSNDLLVGKYKASLLNLKGKDRK